MAKRVTRQGWSQCAGGGGLGSEQELSPPTFSSLLPMGSETMSRFTEVERVPQICIDTDPFPRMLDDALECQVQVSSHRHHQWLPYRKPPAMPEAIICKGDASSGERLCFQQPKQIHTGIFLTFPNPQLKSTLRGPGTMLPCRCRKPQGMVIGLGVGMK